MSGLIDASDRIARTHKLPKDADSAVERSLATFGGSERSGRSCASPTRSPSVGARSFRTSHCAIQTGFLALVEVVGFYTPEYLRSKIGALRGVANRPIIVCIDESLVCDDGEIPGAVLRFRRRISAATLIAAAERERAILRRAHNRS